MKLKVFFTVLILVLSVGCLLLVNNNLTNTNSNLSNQIEQMEKTYSGKLDSMTSYQNTLVTRINTLEGSLAQLSQSYDELNQTYQNAVAQYTLDLEELNTELTGVQNTLSELQASSDVDKAKIEELQNKVSELQQSISEKNVTIDQLNETIEAQQATIDELNTTIDELIAELNSDLSQQLDFYKKLMAGEVTEITVSDLEGVTKIRDYAFYNCNDITSVQLSDSIKSIGTYSFNKCLNLTNFDFGNGLEIIADYAFKECKNTTFGSFSSSLKSIGSQSFYMCSKLSRVDIPNGTESIGNYAFGGASVHSFILPNSLKNLGVLSSSIDNVTVNFNGTLKEWLSINFLDVGGATGLGAYHNFYLNGNELTEITAEDLDGVTTIPAGALTCINGLKKVTLSNTITSLPDYAFYKCLSLSDFSFGDNALITSLPSNCFYCCPLTSFTFTPQITTINSSCFSRLGQYYSGYSPTLKTIYIPSTVTNIISGAFLVNNLIIYCEAETRLEGWNDNFYGSDTNTTLKYGYTYEQYLAETTDTTEVA